MNSSNQCLYVIVVFILIRFTPSDTPDETLWSSGCLRGEFLQVMPAFWALRSESSGLLEVCLSQAPCAKFLGAGGPAVEAVEEVGVSLFLAHTYEGFLPEDDALKVVGGGVAVGQPC